MTEQPPNQQFEPSYLVKPESQPAPAPAEIDDGDQVVTKREFREGMQAALEKLNQEFKKRKGVESE